jgi:hypothetical protein
MDIVLIPGFLLDARLRQVDVVDLPTGHWPQFTRPRELADAVVAAIG